MLAVMRCTEICVGIVSAGVVLARTDFGSASRRLATLFADISTEVMRRFVCTLALAGPELPETQPMRQERIRRVVELDPIIEDAIGESSQLRPHSPVLAMAVGGLFAAVASRRVVAVHFAQLPHDQARQEAATVLQAVPKELLSEPEREEPARWIADPIGLGRICDAGVQALIALPAGTPSLRLLADQTAKVSPAFPTRSMGWRCSFAILLGRCRAVATFCPAWRTGFRLWSVPGALSSPLVPSSSSGS
jgi:hypothetical protein